MQERVQFLLQQLCSPCTCTAPSNSERATNGRLCSSWAASLDIVSNTISMKRSGSHWRSLSRVSFSRNFNGKVYPYGSLWMETAKISTRTFGISNVLRYKLVYKHKNISSLVCAAVQNCEKGSFYKWDSLECRILKHWTSSIALLKASHKNMADQHFNKLDKASCQVRNPIRLNWNWHRTVLNYNSSAWNIIFGSHETRLHQEN